MSATTQALQLLDSSRISGEQAIPEEFWALVDRYRGELVNQALAVTGNLADAEDVVQETFCEAYRNHARLNEVRSLGAWLRTINRGNALNRVRDRRTRNKGEQRRQMEAPPRLSTTGGFSQVEIRELMAKAIETLPPKLRLAVVLRYLEHRSYDEIAKTLSITSGTVGWLLCEAGLLLHEKLKRLYEATPGESDNRRPAEGAAAKE